MNPELESILNQILGANQLFWDPEDANGNLTGEAYIGNSPDFSMSVEQTSIDHWNADSAVEERDKSIVRRVLRSLSFTGDNISPFNLALWNLAEASKKTQSAGSQTSTTINGGAALIADRWYQLGQDSTNPSGVRNVSNVTITADPSGTPVVGVEDTDYTLDAARGRFKVIAGGALDGVDAEGDFDTVADERPQIVSTQSGAKYGALRAIADNTEGPDYDIYIPRVMLMGSGEAAWKDRENWMALQFNGNVLTRTGFEQLYIDGQAVATS